jgi:hypothetical protein
MSKSVVVPSRREEQTHLLNVGRGNVGKEAIWLSRLFDKQVISEVESSSGVYVVVVLMEQGEILMNLSVW